MGQRTQGRADKPGSGYERAQIALNSCKWGIATMILLLTMTGSGCPRSQQNSASSNSTSVADLIGRLPNLRDLEIESCSYIIREEQTASGVPSPSDKLVSICGTVVLTETGNRFIRSKFQWKQLLRSEIPADLSTVLPGDPLVASDEFNDSFTSNPTFAHGFVVLLTSSSERTMYVLASDIDHPIK